MTKAMKQQLLNDILTGLLVAAVFAIVAPHGGFADDLDNVVENTKGNFFGPALTGLGYGCYTAGAFFGVQGLAGVKKHTDAPANNALGPGLGKLAIGGGLIAAPSIVNVIGTTGSNTLGGSGGTATGIQGF